MLESVKTVDGYLRRFAKIRVRCGVLQIPGPLSRYCGGKNPPLVRASPFLALQALFVRRGRPVKENSRFCLPSIGQRIFVLFCMQHSVCDGLSRFVFVFLIPRRLASAQTSTPRPWVLVLSLVYTDPPSPQAAAHFDGALILPPQ